MHGSGKILVGISGALGLAGATLAAPPAKKGVAPNAKTGTANFWSFRPVKPVTPPKVAATAFVASPIDAFILAELEKKNLVPAPKADKRTLLRRASFDLTGLPPTPEEVAAFFADTSPNAFAKVVDRLLASPAYGERWGRHWLDTVRYADSLDARGLGGEGDISEAYRYRDWVVNAFNHDMPYDQFIIHQIAGDTLPSPEGFHREGTIATGFLAIGNWGNGDADKEKILTDIADDQVDVVSRSFLGLTLACARCHNHKFDPLTTEDYYGMAGIFFSTHILPKLTPKGAGETPLRIALLSPVEREKREKHTAHRADVEKRLAMEQQQAYTEYSKSLLPQTAKYIQAALDGKTSEPPGQNLRSDLLERWGHFLGLRDTDRLMTTEIRNLRDIPGIDGWKSAVDPPSLLVNTTGEAKQILTFTLPPKSVAVHPGPKSGVVVTWRSPLRGVVRVSGSVTDADPACGNGIAWRLEYANATGKNALDTGTIPNGGKQSFGEKTSSVSVEPGDKIHLLILPNGEYSCDTTTVTLEIATSDGGPHWGLPNDVLTRSQHSNPQPDTKGNPGVWAFAERAESTDTPALEPKLAQSLTSLRTAYVAVQSGKQERSLLANAVQAFANEYTLADVRSPFYPASREEEANLPEAVRTRLAALRAEQETLAKVTYPAMEYANGAQEGGCPETNYAGFHDVKVHIRGSYARLGDTVPRRFPTVLAGSTVPHIAKGSGRLELAQWIASPQNPLTARVLVNRLWQHHFGTGIVRTPSNFGFLGERPTHPALLDYLANRLVQNGWSLKKMHREILLSATYQQSATGDKKTLAADPDNRLFGRQNRTRLEAESLRDSLLAVAGKLEMSRGGVGTRDLASPRRSLYLMSVRSERTGFGPLFDAADCTASVEKRVVTTVAPQALFLLNNGFATSMAKTFAKRLLSEIPQDDRKRLDRAYRLLYARAPSEKEAAIGLNYLRQSLAAGSPIETVWEEYAQILLCANEFLYVD